MQYIKLSLFQKCTHEKPRKVCKDIVTHVDCGVKKKCDGDKNNLDKSEVSLDTSADTKDDKCQWIWKDAGNDVEVLEKVCTKVVKRDKKPQMCTKERKKCKKIVR